MKTDNIDEILDRIQRAEAPTKELMAILDIVHDLAFEVRRIDNRVRSVETLVNHQMPHNP